MEYSGSRLKFEFRKIETLKPFPVCS